MPKLIGAAEPSVWLTLYSIVTLFESVVVAEIIWIAGTAEKVVLSTHLGSRDSVEPGGGDHARRRATRPVCLQNRSNWARRKGIDRMSSLRLGETEPA
jgi:hypothetical protein